MVKPVSGTFARVAAVALMVLSSAAQAQLMFTFAGGGVNDGEVASTAIVREPEGVAIDAAGNVYVAAFGAVRRIDAATRKIATVAGIGECFSFGDGLKATLAGVCPRSIALDSAGNIYIAEVGGNRIRRVDAASGLIGTVTGSDAAGSSGDGGPAAAAMFDAASAVAVDAAGNLFITDSNNHRVRRVDSRTGIVATVAGNGISGGSGDGGPAAAAQLNRPGRVAIDAAGNLYIADDDRTRLRRVDARTGTISTLAFIDGGRIQSGWMATDGAGNLHYTDGFRIRRIDASTGAVTEVANASGLSGFGGDGGPAREAFLSDPAGIAFDAAGNLYLSDTGNDRLRRIDAGSRVIATVAGAGSRFAGDGAAATRAHLDDPEAVAIDRGGVVYVAEPRSRRVRRIEPRMGTITTLAGTGAGGVFGDGGPAISARLSTPTGVAVDADGNVFIADRGDSRIRRVDVRTGLISTVAGTGFGGTFGDGGPATAAGFAELRRVAVDAAGNLFVTDSNRIRRIDAATGIIDTLPTRCRPTGSSEPVLRDCFTRVADVAVEASGNLLVADDVPGPKRVYRLEVATALVSVLAGGEFCDFRASDEGVPATTACLQGVDGVAVDGAGNVYYADPLRKHVRRVDATTGLVRTIGVPPPAGAEQRHWVRYAGPRGIAIGAGGNVFVAEPSLGRVKLVLVDAAADFDGDGLSGFVEAAEGLNPLVKDNDVFYSSRLFAMQQHRDFLGREATAADVAIWVSQIDSGQRTRARWIESVLASNEFGVVVPPVVRLYFSYFLRFPDYGGLDYWIGQARVGQSLERISDAFAMSPEFVNRYGALSNDQFVALVYQNVLRRAPDAAGFAFWTGQLSSGLTRGQMMLQFSESAEYAGVVANDVYVTAVYYAMLRRTPDEGGFASWVGYLDAGNPRITLIEGFFYSTEYRNRLLP